MHYALGLGSGAHDVVLVSSSHTTPFKSCSSTRVIGLHDYSFAEIHYPASALKCRNGELCLSLEGA